MLHDVTALRVSFDRLGEQYIEFARSLTPDDLARPGLGQWSVRDLLGHGLRAFSTAAANLDASPTVEFTIHNAGEYYRTTFASSPGIHSEIAERGVQAGIALGGSVDDVASVVERTVLDACARVGDADDHAIVNHAVGQVPLPAYLATRVVEAGVHLLDLQGALGRAVGLDAATASIVLLTLAETGNATDLILAITGRTSLPTGYNVLR